MKSLRYAICADIPIGRVAPAAGGGNGKWGPAKGTWLPDATREPGSVSSSQPRDTISRTIEKIAQTGHPRLDPEVEGLLVPPKLRSHFAVARFLDPKDFLHH